MVTCRFVVGADGRFDADVFVLPASETNGTVRRWEVRIRDLTGSNVTVAMVKHGYGTGIIEWIVRHVTALARCR